MICEPKVIRDTNLGCYYFGFSTNACIIIGRMDKLDQLITKFKELKEGLIKNASPLHDTVSGFMTGLKALPKVGPERGRFMTAHIGHNPFINALHAHPEGAVLRGMIDKHLNSPANAGFKPGQTKVVVKGEDIADELDKAIGLPRTKLNAAAEAASSFKRTPLAPKIASAPHPASMPSPEEHAARASMYSDFMPQPGVKKNINGSYDTSPNMAMSRDEKLTLNKGGQWNLEKEEKVCPKCHAKVCQCNKTGVLIDKMDGAACGEGI